MAENRWRRCETYQGTSAKLFGVCLRILKDRSEAEDVLQDVYVTM
jgi:RNA polymerase sigma-70 factor, ECF subfamily